MFATAGGVNQCTGGTPFSSSNYDANWTATKAFDGIKTGDQGWASSTSQTWPTWIGYDFGVGNEKDIVQFSITSRQYNPWHITDSPKNFKLQFSDDNIWWYDAGAPFADVSGWGANETRTFDIVPLAIANKSLHSATFPLVEISASNTNTARSIVAGESEISGRISITGTPTEDILVRLHHSDSGILVKTTKTNTIGDYKFENVDRYSLFDVVAEDPNKLYEKKVSSRRSPFVALKLKTRGRSGEAAGFTFYGDPYWNDVTSYLDFTGADGSTTFTDRKGLTWTPTGSAQINSNSLLLDGNNDYITATPDSSKSFGTGNFTIEAWITLNARASGNNCIFDSLNPGGNGARPNSIVFGVNPSGTLFAFQNGSYVFQAGFVPLSTLIHVAISRVDGVIYGSVAGTIVTSVTNGFNDTVGGFCVGLAADVPSSVPNHTDGRIHNLRITKAGRYNTNFTPEFKLPFG